jgi:LacI family transcriptional regulator
MKKHEKPEYPGIKAIARKANVSIATVDRVIHNRPGVAERTRTKINLIIRDMDFQPNKLASRLASRKVFHFATLIPGVSNETEYWEAPLSGLMRAEEEIKQYGIRIEKYFFDLNDKSSFVNKTAAILKKKYDGVLLAPSFVEESVEFVRALKGSGVPYVFINSDIPDQDSLSYIGPHLFQSGHLGAHLTSYGLRDGEPVLIVNISREMDNHHHLLRKEKGFMSYFRNNNKEHEVLKMDIRQMDHSYLENELDSLLKKRPDIKGIFVTNSRVSAVADFLEKAGLGKITLVGFDFLKENIKYLKKGIIDFLICHKPEEQAYRGIMAFYQTLVMEAPVEKVHFMPIDIITKENYEFYGN